MTKNGSIVIRIYVKPTLVNPTHQRQLESDIDNYRLRYFDIQKSWSLSKQPGLIPLYPIDNKDLLYLQQHSLASQRSGGGDDHSSLTHGGSDYKNKNQSHIHDHGHSRYESPRTMNSHHTSGISTDTIGHDDSNSVYNSASLSNQRGHFLGRQYFAFSLFDRVNVPPYLETIEKKWITYQLLHAVNQAHGTKLMDGTPIVHGDIKTENIMVTSWNWIFLTDFNPFKPDSLPFDHPHKWNLFFSDRRERCYVAPERFYKTQLMGKDYKLSPLADIFSVGCVIAEIFTDGQVLFNHEQLLAYKDNKYDPTQIIAKKISDKYVRELVEQFQIIFCFVLFHFFWCVLLFAVCVFLQYPCITCSL